MSQLAAMIQTKEIIEKELLARPGVTAVDVGYKYVKGLRTDEIAIRVHVAHKRPVTGKEQIPDTFDGYKTDVIERTYVLQPLKMKLEDVTQQADTTRYDPLKGGISIGPDRSIDGYVFAGTLGIIVKDNSTGNPLLLSNFHVMCVDNGWNAGDQMDQPSLMDTGTHSDGIGKLVRSSLSSYVDGALATLSGRTYSCDLVDIGPVNGTAPAVLGSPVRKRGRTTLLTYGFVDGVNASISIDYGDGIGTKILTTQISIRPDTAHTSKFSDEGDSGSVIVDANNKVIGLLFAGSPDGYTVANPISSVLTELGISVDVETKPDLVQKPLKDNKQLRSVLNVFKTTTNPVSPLDASAGTMEKPPVSDFLTVQSFTNFAAMTGAITAAWNALQKLTPQASTIWVPYLFSFVWAVISCWISWDGLKTTKDGSEKADIATVLQAGFVAFINSLVLASAVVGTNIATGPKP